MAFLAPFGVQMAMGLASAVTGKKATGGLTATGKRKRRRGRHLSKADLSELMMIKQTLGRTAAANHLLIMGRGR